MGKKETLEEAIAQVNGSMAIEGMSLSEEDIATLRRSGVSHAAREREIAALVKKSKLKNSLVALKHLFQGRSAFLFGKRGSRPLF
jgi:hypothetical protein